ncbi:hypothetical protein F4825DRAFT_209003 [Nemania diffusa]|nr:hypothetical protein F4825DRAFT_209003 [Nemania diffusa]
MWWQCTCSAFFQTKEGLESHHQDYQSRKQFHAAEIVKCDKHTTANFDIDYSGSEIEDPVNDGDELLYCPRMECNRNSLSSRPFRSLKALRVHIQQHYSCREVCVHCHKSLFTARAYIRHVQSHGQITGRNGIHVDATRQELIKLSNDELYNAPYSKKRKRVQVARTAPALLNIVDEFVEQPAPGTEGPSVVGPIENAEILAA